MGLAPVLVRDIFKVLAEINRAGITMLLVEQNARMALQLASRAYVLESGAMALSGKAADLMNHPRVKEAYLGG
jgi:branched-chain amino acid transport system ATP-binding protein